MQPPRLIDLLFSFNAHHTCANLAAAGCLKDDIATAHDVVGVIEVGFDAYNRVIAIRPPITGPAPYLSHIVLPLLNWAGVLTAEADRLSAMDTTGSESIEEMVACSGCDTTNHSKAVYCRNCGEAFSN